MTESTVISDSEWRVMQVIWNQKTATAADVIDALADSGWSHRTIRTLLSRLVDKGVLETEPIGNRYLYRPTVTRSKCVREVGQTFLQRVFGGNAEELLMHFARHSKIDAEQIERLKQQLDKRQEKNK